jgi:predicted XRE-type DNA-binding protein
MAKGKIKSATPQSAFHALGLEDADDLVLRTELMRKIALVVENRHLTQTEAGKLIGMDQPRMSALIHGKITKFSTERLIKALNDLGHDIELRIRPSIRERGVTRVIGVSSSRQSKAA